MNSILDIPPSDFYAVLQTGLSVSERATVLIDDPDGDAPEGDAPVDSSAFAPWIRAMRISPSELDDRLSRMGMSRRAFAQALEDLPLDAAELERDASASAVASPSGFDWQGAIREVMEGTYADTVLPPTAAFAPPPASGKAPPSSDLLPFDGFMRPFLQFAVGRLRERVATSPVLSLSQVAPDAPFLLDTLRTLTEQIAHQSLRTLTLELQVARHSGLLQGDTPEERFRYYATTHLREALPDLLSEYAVLARRLVERIDAWVTHSTRFLHHLTEDRTRLDATFEPLGALTGVTSDVADPHLQGSVIIASFENGTTLVYKPRSLAIDAWFQRVLERVNAEAPQHRHRTLSIVAGAEHGWMEFVEASPCASHEEVAAFYWRQGSLLALLHLCYGTDVHYENVIAAGSCPVIVDLETLFHPTVDPVSGSSATQTIRRDLSQSVLRTGLLPFLMGDGDGVDVSGLGGRGGQTLHTKGDTVAKSGTDAMRIEPSTIALETKQNRPTPDASSNLLYDHRSEILDGFRETLQLVSHTPDAFATLLDEAADAEVRVLFRPTQYYGLVLRELCHPDVLRDGRKRDTVLAHLWAEATVRPHLLDRVASEWTALQQDAIPRFTMRPGDTTVSDDAGNEAGTVGSSCMLDAARQRLQSLTGAHIREQARLIDTVITQSTPLDDRDSPWDLLPSQTSTTPITPNTARKAAAGLAHLLCDRSHGNNTSTSWIGLDFSLGPDGMPASAPSVAPMNGTLFDGVCGVALFLAYAADQTGTARFRDEARRALATARALYRNAPVLPAGGFVGAPAYVYLLHHLHMLWDDASLQREMDTVLERVRPALTQDTAYDLVGGSAGALTVFLNLYEATGQSAALEAATACGDHLHAQAHPFDDGIGWIASDADGPSTGFSHGIAGIAWPLVRLGLIADRPDDLDLAADAVRLERHLMEAWRTRLGGSGHAVWCHGPLGIAFGRALIVNAYDHVGISCPPVFDCGPEVKEALREVHLRGRPDATSLSYGAAGTVDVLDVLRTVADTPDAVSDRAHRLRTDLIRYAATVTQRDDAVQFDLMYGLSGVGMTLLRAASDAVPSVLRLDPPMSSSS